MKHISRKIISSLIIIFCALLSTDSWSQEKLSANDWLKDVDYLVKLMKIMHPNVYRNISEENFVDATNRLRQEIPSLSDTDIIIEFHKLVALVGDGHTYIWVPAKFQALFHYFPVRFHQFSDGLYIIAADRTYKDLVGKKVIRFGNLSAEEAVSRVCQMIRGDNKYGKLRELHIYMSNAEVLKHFGVSDSVEKLHLQLAGDDGKLVDGEIEAWTKPPIPRQKLYELLIPLHPATSETIATMNEESENPLPRWISRFNDYYWQEYLPEFNTEYVQINSMNNKQDENFADFCTRFFKIMAEKGADRLIIDIRNNLGGNHIEMPLLKGIISRPNIDTSGKLFLLISRNTFSAAQHLTSVLERYTNVIIVGEPTSGRPNQDGGPRSYTLPKSGLGLSLSIEHYQDSDPWDLRCTTKPEIMVDLTSSDYRANHDSALERCLKFDWAQEQPGLTGVLSRSFQFGGIDVAMKTYSNVKEKYAKDGWDVEKQLLDFLWDIRMHERVKPSVLFEKVEPVILKEYPDSYSGYYLLARSADNPDTIKKYLRKTLEVNNSYFYARQFLETMELDEEYKAK